MSAIKTLLVYVFDVSSTVSEPVIDAQGLALNGGASKLAIAKSFVCDHITDRLLNSKTFECAAISVGDHDAEPTSFSTTVKAHVVMNRPDFSTLQTINEQVRCDARNRSNFVDSVLFAHDMLMTSKEKRLKFNRFQVFLTDGETEINENDVEDLNVALNSMVDPQMSGDNCGLHIIMIGKCRENSSATKKGNAEFYSKITSEIGCSYMECDSLDELVTFPSMARGMANRFNRSKCNLECIESFKIPCVYYSYVQAAKTPNLKKRVLEESSNSSSASSNSSAISEESFKCGCDLPAKRTQSFKDNENKGRYFYTCPKGYNVDPTRCKFFKWSKDFGSLPDSNALVASASSAVSNASALSSMSILPEGSAIVAKREFIVENLTAGKEVAVADRVKGYKYGPQIVPLTSADEESIRLISEPVLRVLEFIPTSKVPRHHYIDHTIVIEGAPEHASCQKMVKEFGDTLKALDQVCIVRFVKKENSEPQLAVISPCLFNQNAIVLHRLPCSDDIRDYSFPSLKIPKQDEWVANKKRNIISEYVDSMTIMNPGQAQICPRSTSISNVNEWVRDNLLKQFKVGETTAENTLVHIQPLEDVFRDVLGAGGRRDMSIGAIENAFELKRSVKSGPAKKSFWSEMELSTPSSKPMIEAGGGGVVVSNCVVAQNESK